LRSEDNGSSTIDIILLRAISLHPVNPVEAPLGAFVQQVDYDVIMMKEIISFVPLETCSQNLQKHLEQCHRLSGKYMSVSSWIMTDVHIFTRVKERKNERAKDELERYERCEQDIINDLEYKYERALALKENRLQEYLNDVYKWQAITK
jgi:hypothetical protein